jgi:hypothetical protein
MYFIVFGIRKGYRINAMRCDANHAVLLCKAQTWNLLARYPWTISVCIKKRKLNLKNKTNKFLLHAAKPTNKPSIHQKGSQPPFTLPYLPYPTSPPPLSPPPLSQSHPQQSHSATPPSPVPSPHQAIYQALSKTTILSYQK